MREVKTTEMQNERSLLVILNYFHVCGSRERMEALRHIEDVLLFILKCDILQKIQHSSSLMIVFGNQKVSSCNNDLHYVYVKYTAMYRKKHKSL
jgi:hypothetical protein